MSPKGLWVIILRVLDSVRSKVQSVSSCVPFLMSVWVLSEFSESKDLIGGSTGESFGRANWWISSGVPFGRSNRG